jgi:hypothetical protein
MDMALRRETGVSDDLFGRWLQDLAGRQIVVLLDSCFSGGFATNEKGAAAKEPAGFDFLDGELTRLKDIGEDNQAMLAASCATETAMELPNGENGLFTFCVLHRINGQAGPVRIEDCFAACEEMFPAFYDALNARLTQAGEKPVHPQHPFMVNRCREAVLLKP